MKRAFRPSKDTAFRRVLLEKPLSASIVKVTAIGSICTVSTKPNGTNHSPSFDALRLLSAAMGNTQDVVKSPYTPAPASVHRTAPSTPQSTNRYTSSPILSEGLAARTRLQDKTQHKNVHRGYNARFHSDLAAVKQRVRLLFNPLAQDEDTGSIGEVKNIAKNSNAGDQGSTAIRLPLCVGYERRVPESGMKQRGVAGKSIVNIYADRKSSGDTRRKYIFSHGATGFPKTVKTASRKDYMRYASKGVGEDAYFARHDSVGVADGVGGWCNTPGANPAIFSRNLMHYAHQELEKYDKTKSEEFNDYYKVDPVQVMRRSFDLTSTDAARQGIVGSTTACVAIFRNDELRIANLGDCGVSVIRRKKFIFRTKEQQHYFNCPYQLGTGSMDAPEDSHCYTVKIQKGDIVIVGSDGLYDNVFDEDILEEVVSCTVPPVPLPISSSWGITTADTARSNPFPRLTASQVAAPTRVY